MTTETKNASASDAAAFKKWRDEQNKSAATRAKESAATEKLQKSQTVEHTVLKTNGEALHLCADGEWRTDNDLSKLGVEE